ncbi:zinc finger protein 703-like [Electrophorus electricus]|uniref:C2H2-type domain-containing protein n=1 Tax=Electrophorus electricus TaxID=8005 RepID=A0A4W4G4V7_ELEEL|nr:zinc finger protein 703-like [Electrophorus electricus]
MKITPGGSTVHSLRSPTSQRPAKEHRNFALTKVTGIKNLSATSLKPSDPLRQAKRLPVKILKMLTAHSGHLLHPEYLQPLTSAPVSIELDAKKSPLALLAQTCSQIGKTDPPSSSKLASITSSGLSDKDSSARTSSAALKLGEQRPSHDDKSSFKPYSKIGPDSQRDGSNTNSSTNKPGFCLPMGGGNASNSTQGCQSHPPHTLSPSSRGSSPPQTHRQALSPGPARQTGHSQAGSGEPKPTDTASLDSSSNLKKEAELSKVGLDSPQLANSSHARASANSSSGSSDCSPSNEGKVDSHTAQPGGLVPVSISPFKSSHPMFPLPSSGMGYHGSIVGTYAGYPGQFVPGLDPTKSSLGGAGVGKHPSSSPLTGASPPSFMQGLCRDPYCLSYPNAPHLGGSSCSSCVHDPSSSLKSGFPLVYPAHPLHSIHQSSLSSSVTPSLSHPLYTYGFMVPNEPLPHACNWVSATGPCDKRFGTSEELLAHLRTHTSLPGVDGKLLSAYPPSSSSAAAAAAAASCHLHLPGQSSPAPFSLRAPPSLGLARYHPYSKMHLPATPSLPMHSLPASAPYYSHYALYSQRLGSASALGYQ